MENSNKNDKSEKVCVLLPFCDELETDVFLNVLKHVVGRSKLPFDHHLECFKDGMTAHTLYIESNDLLVNWNESDSKSQRIRQMKILGFWTAYNYPIFGKKLFGETWQPPQCKSVEILGDSSVEVSAINEVVFRKMKLRIMELSVCHSTLAKLKYFVRIPDDIAKFNGFQVSHKIMSFVIGSDQAEDCWKPLKLGKFPMSEVR